MYPLQRLGGIGRDQLARRRVTREGDDPDVGAPNDRVPDGDAVAGDDVEHARWQEVRRQLRELERGERRHLGGLQDDRVPGRHGGSDLPDRHHQRVVPRRDQPRDADRLSPDVAGEARHVLTGRPALHRAGRAREEAQVVDDRGDLLGKGHGGRLADVLRLELDDLVGVLLDPVRELEEGELAILGRRVVPVALERGPRGRHGLVRVFLRALLDRGEHLAGRRVDHVARLSVR